MKEPRPEELAAFKETYGKSFQPKSVKDRRRMAKIQKELRPTKRRPKERDKRFNNWGGIIK